VSISSRQNEVARHQKSIADLQNKLADESKKEVSKTDEINRIERSITKSTPVSTLRSKQQQITRAMSAIADIQKKKANISKKITDANTKLHKAQEDLRKEEEKKRKKNS
jgi:predicted  nucleic acid-binding Zn-ribbon protein